jgi:hypothetical protein
MSRPGFRRIGREFAGHAGTRRYLLSTWNSHHQGECPKNLSFSVNNGVQNTSMTMSGAATMTCQ